MMLRIGDRISYCSYTSILSREEISTIVSIRKRKHHLSITLSNHEVLEEPSMRIRKVFDALNDQNIDKPKWAPLEEFQYESKASKVSVRPGKRPLRLPRRLSSSKTNAVNKRVKEKETTPKKRKDTEEEVLVATRNETCNDSQPIMIENTPAPLSVANTPWLDVIEDINTTHCASTLPLLDENHAILPVTLKVNNPVCEHNMGIQSPGNNNDIEEEAQTIIPQAPLMHSTLNPTIIPKVTNIEVDTLVEEKSTTSLCCAGMVAKDFSSTPNDHVPPSDITDEDDQLDQDTTPSDLILKEVDTCNSTRYYTPEEESRYFRVVETALINPSMDTDDASSIESSSSSSPPPPYDHSSNQDSDINSELDQSCLLELLGNHLRRLGFQGDAAKLAYYFKYRLQSNHQIGLHKDI